jgi:hypothetical protein
LPHVTHSVNECWGAYKHEFLPLEPFLRFSQRTCPISTLGLKLMFGVVAHNFVAACHPFRKRVSGCIQSTRFCHRNYFFVFCQRTCPIHYFRSKNKFGVLSCNFVATHHQFRKRVSRCKQARVLATGTISLLFRNEHAQSTTLGPKLTFGVVSRNFVAARHPLRK